MGTITRPYIPSYTAPGEAPLVRPTGRVVAVDILRGAVMVLMAIDHVRVYAGVPAGGPTPGVFLTRWITHFCAPVFILLAGASTYLQREKFGSRRALSRFLVTRGLWLVALELTVLRFAWTFNADYAHFTFAGVIWVIGWSMIVLAGLVFLPTSAVASLGLAVIFGHNAVGAHAFAVSGPSWLLRVAYVGGAFSVGGARVQVLYSLVPWVGVMAAGYGFGAVLRWPAPRRRRACTLIGGAAVLLFVALRLSGAYGNPWVMQGPPMPFLLAFLDTLKYPASLQFLLMTLGPALLVLPVLETAHGRVTEWLSTFGRAPFFFYLLHIPVIHAVALFISLVRTPASTWWLIANHPMQSPPVPDGYRWSLPLLYLVTAVVVWALYFPSRWFAQQKAEHRRRWTSYF